MDVPERDAAILSLTLKVKYIAGAFSRASFRPANNFPDLYQAGWLGAIRAVERYDPERGVLLGSFAERHIRGAIQDYLRGIDPLSRSHRLQQKAGVGVPVKTISIDRVGHDETAVTPAHGCIEARADVAALLRRTSMRPRNLAIVRRHYLGEESQGSLAREFGLSPGRVAQICASGVAALRIAASTRAAA